MRSHSPVQYICFYFVRKSQFVDIGTPENFFTRRRQQGMSGKNPILLITFRTHFLLSRIFGFQIGVAYSLIRCGYDNSNCLDHRQILISTCSLNHDTYLKK